MSISIPNFSQTRILVVGDTMLDRYWTGSANRMSPEAPVPVVNIQSSREVPGGAGNVALNLRGLGVQVSLAGLIGQDADGVLLQTLLEKTGVQSILKSVPGLPTITKLRVVGRNQQLVRLDFEQGFHQVDMTQLLQQVREQLEHVQALVISDYNKGINACIPELIAMAAERKIPVLVDPKNQDFSLYRGATILTPNLKEFEAVVGVCRTEQEIVNKGLALLAQFNFPALLITRGEQGMTLLRDDSEALHFSAQTSEVYDVTGAGDTVIAVLAACLASGSSYPDAVMMANTAAGVSVKKLGAASVSVHELRRALQRLNDSHLGIVNREELIQSVADARAHGETVVLTNGCFDILHAGHVYYLEQAKALGDRLIVAVNTDESIRRLKGATRPVVSLHERMMVLAGLRSVDWVVPFSADTPLQLIQDVLPDVLVKGADYTPMQIAGAKEVLAAGGRVETIKLLPGASTSNIIEKIFKLEESIL